MSSDIDVLNFDGRRGQMGSGSRSGSGSSRIQDPMSRNFIDVYDVSYYVKVENLDRSWGVVHEGQRLKTVVGFWKSWILSRRIDP